MQLVCRMSAHLHRVATLALLAGAGATAYYGAEFSGPGCIAPSVREWTDSVPEATHGECWSIGDGFVRGDHCDMSGAVPMERGTLHSDSSCSGAGEAYALPADGSCVEYNRWGMPLSFVIHCTTDDKVWGETCTSTVGDVEHELPGMDSATGSAATYSLQSGLNWGTGRCYQLSSTDCRAKCHADPWCIGYEVGTDSAGFSPLESHGSNCCIEYCRPPNATGVFGGSAPVCDCWTTGSIPDSWITTESESSTAIAVSSWAYYLKDDPALTSTSWCDVTPQACDDCIPYQYCLDRPWEASCANAPTFCSSCNPWVVCVTPPSAPPGTVCDAAKCSSDGDDCYADGTWEQRTCLDGFLAHAVDDGWEYTCCPPGVEYVRPPSYEVSR